MLVNTDWCLRSDVVTDLRLQAVSASDDDIALQVTGVSLVVIVAIMLVTAGAKCRARTAARFIAFALTENAPTIATDEAGTLTWDDGCENTSLERC